MLPANTTLNLVRAPCAQQNRVHQRRAEDRYGELAALGACTHASGMFVVTEAEAAAIRTAFDLLPARFPHSGWSVQGPPSAYQRLALAFHVAKRVQAAETARGK